MYVCQYLFFCDIIIIGDNMNCKELEEVYKTNPELAQYINEYLNTEYNTSKNTITSYATDICLLAKYYPHKNIKKKKKEDIQYFFNF